MTFTGIVSFSVLIFNNLPLNMTILQLMECGLSGRNGAYARLRVVTVLDCEKEPALTLSLWLLMASLVMAMPTRRRHVRMSPIALVSTYSYFRESTSLSNSARHFCKFRCTKVSTRNYLVALQISEYCSTITCNALACSLSNSLP